VLAKEISSRIDEWEEQGCYDQAIFKRRGDLGPIIRETGLRADQ
jgi:hypothetical protein